MSGKMRRFIDIGANLTDSMYSGIYNGSRKHEPDLEQVLKRSWNAGLTKIIITGGNLAESQKALDLAKSDDRLYATVGCHPTRCLEFEENGKDPAEYLESLRKVINDGGKKIVAIGECGLDFDRIHFCPKEIQKKNAADDLYGILQKYNSPKGVVHSFDGTIEEANRFISLGYYLGLNGCSLKTKENLDTVAALPQDRILIETDCPWCEIRPTHAGYQFIDKDNLSIPSVKKEKWKQDHMVKSRNEPNNIRQVLDVIAAARKEDPEALCQAIYANTIKLFFPTEQ